MSNTNIGWHTRLVSDNTVKVVGGSFGGSIDQHTVERLIKAHMHKVRVLPSGTPIFVDKAGREVRLYLSVDPKFTEMGRAALRAYHEEMRRKAELDELERERRQEELDDAMSGLPHDEIIRRLKQGD